MKQLKNPNKISQKSKEQVLGKIFKTYLWLILIFCSLLILSRTSLKAQNKLNPNFDLSSVKEFWKIMDILTKDKEPSQKQWQQLFDSTGHNTLRREFKDEFFKKYLRAAYMPSQIQVKKEILDKAKKSSGWFNQWFPKSEFEALAWTLKNRKKVEAEVQSFEKYPYTSKATSQALKFLPETEVKSWPRVAFVIFNDSRGYDPVVMSLNHIARQKSELPENLKKKLVDAGLSEHWPHVLYFAHEFFHYFRGLKEEFTFPEKSDPNYTLVWLLDQIENEGIADQINVKQLYGKGDPFADSELAEKEMKGRENAAEEIKEFSELLTAISQAPKWTYGLSKQAKMTITRSGHVAGYYMANIILEHYPLKSLVNIVRNPFKFFYLYNLAAKKDGNAPVFTKESIKLIQELELKYKK